MTRHIRTFDSVVRLDPAHLCCPTFFMVYRAAKLLVWDVRKFKQPFILRPCEMDQAQWNDLESTGLRTPSAINCKIYCHFVTIKVPAAVGIGRLEQLEMGSEASNWEPLGMVGNALTMKEKIKAIGTSSGKRLEVVALDKFLGG
ncbi:unnamed protein product [Sphagnum jensenii]